MSRPSLILYFTCLIVKLRRCYRKVVYGSLLKIILNIVPQYWVNRFTITALPKIQIKSNIWRLTQTVYSAYCEFLDWAAVNWSFSGAELSPTPAQWNRPGLDRAGRRHASVRVGFDTGGRTPPARGGKACVGTRSSGIAGRRTIESKK